MFSIRTFPATIYLFKICWFLIPGLQSDPLAPIKPMSLGRTLSREQESPTSGCSYPQTSPPTLQGISFPLMGGMMGADVLAAQGVCFHMWCQMLFLLPSQNGNVVKLFLFNVRYWVNTRKMWTFLRAPSSMPTIRFPQVSWRKKGEEKTNKKNPSLLASGFSTTKMDSPLLKDVVSSVNLVLKKSDMPQNCFSKFQPWIKKTKGKRKIIVVV